MSGRQPPPRLFIGSSVEGLEIAYALQESLQFDAEATVWPQGVFSPSASTLHELIRVSHATDFAVLVFTPDDTRVMRKEPSAIPRDNVVFELGLLIGALGADRCWFLTPSDMPPQLPTDLLGLTPLTYVADRRDRNLLAALGPAANKMRRAMHELGPLPLIPAPAKALHSLDPVAEATAALALWDEGDLLAARGLLAAGVPMHSMEDETGEATAAVREIFWFLESVADGVLSGRLDRDLIRKSLAASLRAFWQFASLYLAPLNHDGWDPMPKLAELDHQWEGRPV